ncbi:MAG: diacylglycerol kinase family lipid kinase [Planctomycetes bacterium]|nr:diacylglycerol kinase family lipid kinase [Planctomycetota bacterium]
MNAQPLWVIANPRAGRGRGARRGERLAAALRAARMPFELRRTDGPGHAQALASAAPGGVVAVGGDGTVHEVLNGLRPHGDRLGPLSVLAAGSGNDFARNAGFPRAASALVARLGAGTTRTIDVGVATYDDGRATHRRRFANDAGIGFEADVLAAAAGLRWPRGRLLYVLATLRALRRQRPVDCRVDAAADGPPPAAGPLLFASACNGPRVGGGLPFAPAARLDDGLLDLLCVRSTTPWATFGLLLRLLANRHLADARARILRCPRAVLTPADPLPLAMDGERIADAVTRLEVGIAPERLLLAI